MKAEYLEPRDGNTYSFIPENVLTKAEVELYGQNYWLLPNNKSGHIEFDLGCPKNINTIEFVNTHNGAKRNRGTKAFTVDVRNSLDGQWTEVMNKTSLVDPSILPDSLLSGRHNFKSVTARYVRFNILSFYGKGGGLQYLDYSLKGKTLF